jgi:hypothetical protein
MRRWLIFLLLLVIVIHLAGLIIPTNMFHSADYSLTSKTEVEQSKYHVGGSWWGYNQSKIASLGDTVFSSNYDNRNLKHGNSSEENPYFCHFTKIHDGKSEVFGYAPSNATCNVQADVSRHLVHYIVSEPMGEAATGGYGWTNGSQIAVYTYSFDSSTQSVSLVNKKIVIESGNDGRQRLGTAINGDGQLMIAYGGYDAMNHVYIYDPIHAIWSEYHYLSNPDNDSLMYNYAIIKSLTEFYVLAIQDTSRNGKVYYQYIKFFGYKDGIWSDHMVVDYRESPEALSKSNMVEHTAFVQVEDDIHIVIRAMNQYLYFIYDGTEFIQQPFDYIHSRAKWIRIIPTKDDLLFVYNDNHLLNSYMEGYSQSKQKMVFRESNFVPNAYLYTHLLEDGSIANLGYCGSDQSYDRAKAYLYLLEKF